MDVSSIWNTSTAIVSGIAALAGGAIGALLKWIDVRQKLATLSRELQQAKDDAESRRAVDVRAARDIALGLEAFALACYALRIENARADRAGDGIDFGLPTLGPGGRAGNSRDALELESAYSDLEQQIRAANDHIDETYRDTYNAGPQKALMVHEIVVLEVAALALKLAARYRESFGVPRMPLGRREQRIEEEILSRAANEDAASPDGH
ncbi:hypothetical protein [Burkholderia plantarii]|uniref:Uncharacterized protein n=1 Tax=Burkholderia plantarii TaxID=41899 RepID=A0A0B6RYR2_BURPL|nr:hypothetical protein [Burkholderia plantarii]AJK46210.1 hypothetical protein BGL_1c17010 [Burkholderia plantarii]